MSWAKSLWYTPHKKILETLTCMRGRLTETVSKCCCQEILLLKTDTDTTTRGRCKQAVLRSEARNQSFLKACEHRIINKNITFDNYHNKELAYLLLPNDPAGIFGVSFSSRVLQQKKGQKRGK